MEEATVNDLIEGLCRSFQPERAEGFESSVQIHLEGENGGDWTILIGDGTCTAQVGKIENPKLSVEASTQDVLDIYEGKLDPLRAFMQGKLKMTGDKGMALKMITLFKVER